MSYKKHKIEKPKGSTIRVYSRLIRRFGMKYWPAMLIGILSSLLIGGAMASALRVMDVSFNVFERGTALVEHDGKAPAVAAVPAKTVSAEDLPSVSHSVASAQSQEPNRGWKADSKDKSIQKSQKLIDRINRLIGRFGIEPIDENAALDLNTVFILLLLLAMFLTVQAFGDWIHRFSLKWLGARVVTDIRQELFGKMIRQSVGFFSRHEVGQLISRCTNDIHAIETIMSTSLPELCISPIFILVSIQFIYSKARMLGLGTGFLLMLLVIPVCVAPVYAISRALKRYENRILEGIAGVISRMQESFSGINIIKAFNQENNEDERFRAVNEDFFKRFKKAIAADVLIHPALQLAALLGACVFVLLCYRYGVSLGSLAIMGFAAQQAYKPVKDLAKINAAIQRSAAAAERIFEMLDTDTSLPVPNPPMQLKKFAEKIVFKDVSFKYDTTDSDRNVLENINLTIPRGHQIALVGQTGCGKSTMALLLSRFYDPSSGSISIDGTDIRNFRVEDFRSQVGIVSQDTFLFNTTIAENIRFGRPDASMEEVINAAHMANVMEFVNKLPGGLEYKVGERGHALSGGQRQRIAIARAILCNPPILILDEATSALDPVTEHLIQDALDNVMKDRTVLAIAHRLTTIRNADCIVVMDEGRILESGTHEELLSLNGVYSRLHHISS